MTRCGFLILAIAATMVLAGDSYAEKGIDDDPQDRSGRDAFSLACRQQLSVVCPTEIEFLGKLIKKPGHLVKKGITR